MAAPILPPPDEKLLAKALVVAEASQWTTEGSQSIGLPSFFLPFRSKDGAWGW